LSYEAMLDSSAADALFFAGVPELMWTSLPAVIREPNDSFRPAGAGGGALRYGVHAFLPEEVAPGTLPRRPVPLEVLQCCLELPPLDPRIGELARRLADGFTSAHDCSLAIQRYLRGNYRYNRKPPAEPPGDPLAWFLFEKREGHCEYFASAMAVLLRAVGIPSRVVTGFQGGVYNPVSGWHVLRACDAHAWVEAYLPATGWTSFDPTPPTAPPPEVSPLAWLGFYLDAAETLWHEWVLSYDLAHQLVLAARMERSGRSLGARWLQAAGARWGKLREGAAGLGRSWLRLALAVAVAALAATLGPHIVRRWRARRGLRRIGRGHASAAEGTLLYRRMLRLLERHGYQKPPWLTPAEFASALPASDLAERVREFTRAYNRLRFGGESDAGPALVAMLAALERAQPEPARQALCR
ncbi:MAG: transglutaminase-like domain-containing protein, partial [Bryobacteraceae bacterium]